MGAASHEWNPYNMDYSHSDSAFGHASKGLLITSFRTPLAVLAALALLGGIAVPTASANAATLNVENVTVTWDEATFYAPDGCSSFAFDYANNIGFELLTLRMLITDQYGSVIDRESEIGVKSGASGRWDVQICSFELTNGLGPYQVQLNIQDYNSVSRFSTLPLTFIARPAAPSTSTPTTPSISTSTTPTVTTTATTPKKSTVKISAKRTGAKTKISGVVKVAGVATKGTVVQIQRKVSGLWAAQKTIKTKSGGKISYSLKIAKGKVWRLVVPTTSSIKGSTSKSLKK